MQSPVNLLLMAGICLLVGFVMPCYSDPLPMGQDTGSRPVRPKVFTSPEELRKYLDDLSDYYAYVGRPRFGKRLASPAGFRPISSNGGAANLVAAEAINSGRYPPSANINDLYELLFQYDE